MKASELVLCGEFNERLAATMRDFFTLHFGGDWRVATIDKASLPGSQRWLVNALINAVFIPSVKEHTLEVVRREFGTSVVAWKRLLQKLYFRLATSRAARLLAHATIAVQPPVPSADRWLIVTGTHKVRFIDSAACISYCCRKAGSPVAHFQREIEARQFATRYGVPVPRIVASLSDGCLAESMVVGTPLNRLTSLREQSLGLRTALEAMEPLYNATAQVAGLSQYATSVVSQIEAIAESLPQVAEMGPVPMAKTLLETIIDSPISVELVRAHGDFQPGNILFDQGQVWLIDWEFSTERSRSFDRLTYELRTRYTPDLAKRIIYRAGECSDKRVNDELRLFMLETLLFECEQAVLTPGAVRVWLPKKLTEFRKALAGLSNSRRSSVQ